MRVSIIPACLIGRWGIDRRISRSSRSKGPSLRQNEKRRSSTQRLSSHLDSSMGCFEWEWSTIDSCVWILCGSLGSIRRCDFVVCHWRLVLRYQKTHAIPSVSLPRGYVSDYEFFAIASALHLPSLCQKCDPCELDTNISLLWVAYCLLLALQVVLPEQCPSMGQCGYIVRWLNDLSI